MEEKEIKIVPPEGYEIDRENSTCDVIKFKPINKGLTYKDICDKLFPSQYLYITSSGDITSRDLKEGKYDKNSSTYRGQLQKVLAINQLMNIAKYYNIDWKPDWNDNALSKYYIIYEGKSSKYEISRWSNSNFGMPCFISKENAQAVIDNPNFRAILDRIFK